VLSHFGSPDFSEAVISEAVATQEFAAPPITPRFWEGNLLSVKLVLFFAKLNATRALVRIRQPWSPWLRSVLANHPVLAPLDPSCSRSATRAQPCLGNRRRQSAASTD
jgi:hypothetical protein